MMKKVMALSTLLALAACGGSEVSKSDVQKAVDSSARHSNVCIPFQLAVEHRLPQDDPQLGMLGMPQVKLLKRLTNGKRANEQAIEQMDILVGAGLYKQGKDERIGNGDEAIRYVVYNLTPEGMNKVYAGPKGTVLCIGTQKVEKINYFTEPSPANGVIITQVSYQSTVAPAPWAKKLLKNDLRFEDMKGSQTRITTLVKTNEGWRDIRELAN